MRGGLPYFIKALCVSLFMLCLLTGGSGYIAQHSRTAMMGYSELSEGEEVSESTDNPDDDSQEEEFEPDSLEHYEDGAIVYNYDDLKEALTNTATQYPVIYLGDNIALSGSIQLPFERTDVELVGINPLTGTRHSLTENTADTSADTANIYMPEPGGSQIIAMNRLTIRDIDLIGFNYFGPVHFRNSAARYVLLVYENVSYTGPQPVVHRTGQVVFDNSSFTLQYNGGSTAGELAEAAQVTMRRKVTVNVASMGGDSVVYLVSGVQHPLSFTVAAGAEVVVNNERNTSANNVFLYSDQNNYSISFEQGSTFTYNGKRGFIRNCYPGNVTIANDAKVHITASDVLDYRLFELRGLLDIKSGGELIIENKTNSSYASLYLENGASINLDRNASLLVYHRAPGYAVRVGNNTTSKLTFTQPKRVVLLSSKNTPLYFDGNTAEDALHIEAEQLNRWTAVPEEGGSFSGAPAQHWTTDGLLELTAGGNSTGFTTIDSNYSPAEDPSTDLLFGKGEGEQLSPSVFRLENTRVIAFGAMEIVEWAAYSEVEPSAYGQIASPLGFVNIQFADQQGYTGWATTVDNRSDENGLFSVPLPALTPLPAVMYVQSGYDYLYSYKTPYPINRLGIIAQNLRFETSKLAPVTTLIKRDEAWNLQVIDAVNQGTSMWTLSVRITKQLAGKYENMDVTLQNVLVYIDDDKIIPLPTGLEPTLVVAMGNGTATHLWGPEAGILAKIKTGAAYQTLYTGELEWTLSLVP